MPYKAIKQAEQAFRTAIYGRAAQFDKTTIHRAESLLLQARSLAEKDPSKSKRLAEDAKEIALEAIAKASNEKIRLKGRLSSDVASLIQEYSQDKARLGNIKERINKSTYLIISQRMKIAEVCMNQAKEGLEKEQFSAFPELYARTKQRLSDVANVLNPLFEQLHYTEPMKISPRNSKIKS